MNRRDVVGPDGGHDLEAMRASDELLDRLGRREPMAGDLDDALTAALAVLAGDVDLRPVPVSATRAALAARAAWPLGTDLSGWDSARPAEPPPVLVPGPSLPVVTSAPVPLSGSAFRSTSGTDHPVRRRDLRASNGRSAAGPSARRGPVPQLDHPRVLRLRPAMGVAAAAALVLVGGGVAAAVTGGQTLNPLGGIRAVLNLGDDPTTSTQPPTRDGLVQRVEQAKKALAAGKPADAQKILDGVKDQLGQLPNAQQQEVATQVAGVEQQLPPETATSWSSGSSGSSGDSGATGRSGLWPSSTANDAGSTRTSRWAASAPSTAPKGPTATTTRSYSLSGPVGPTWSGRPPWRSASSTATASSSSSSSTADSSTVTSSSASSSTASVTTSSDRSRNQPPPAGGRRGGSGQAGPPPRPPAAAVVSAPTSAPAPSSS